MCGLIATFGGKDPITDAQMQYGNQWARGNEGFGFIALQGTRLVAWGRHTTEKGIELQLDEARKLKPDGILFHHRFPTSTINVEEAAHPLPIDKKSWKHRYWMLHNGVVSGQDEDEIKKDGYTMKSRITEVKYYQSGTGKHAKVHAIGGDSEVNDSEYLGYYVASLLEGKRDDIPMSGAVACLVLRQHKQTNVCELFVMRNTMNPLDITRDKKLGTLMMSSQSKVGVTLEPNVIHKFDLVKRTFSLYKQVPVGKSYAQATGFGAHSMWGAYGSYGEWMERTAAKDVPAAPATLALPTATQALAEAMDSSSEDSIKAQELERLTNEADKLYADYAEARDTWGEDDTPEAQAYIADCLRLFEEAEEARDELAEENIQAGAMPF